MIRGGVSSGQLKGFAPAGASIDLVHGAQHDMNREMVKTAAGCGKQDVIGQLE